MSGKKLCLWLSCCALLVALRTGHAAIVVTTEPELLVNTGRSAPNVDKAFITGYQLHEGQVVFYTVRVENTGDSPEANVEVTKAIPENTRYVANSAAGPGTDISFSIDGGKSFAPPRELKAQPTAEGRAADPTQYTHIRWRMRYPLAPGAVALLRFRALFR